MSSLMETESLSNTKVGMLQQLSDKMETWYMWLKSRCPTVLYISFEFHSNSFTIKRSFFLKFFYSFLKILYKMKP